MRTIYAVSQGEYSDYRVLVLCEDQETADRIVAEINESDDSSGAYCTRVEEFCLVPPDYKPNRVECHRAEAVLFDNGTVGTIRQWSYTKWEFEVHDPDRPKRPKFEFISAPFYGDHGGALRVYGRTAEGVTKVLNDRLAQFKSGVWNPFLQPKGTK